MINVKETIENYAFKRTILHSNTESILLPFLHGAQIQYRQFGSYIFIQNTKDNMHVLVNRNFTPFTSAISDAILKLGNVIYNKKFNLLFIMVSEKDWEQLNICLDISESLDSSMEIKGQYLVHSMKILSNKHIKFEHYE